MPRTLPDLQAIALRMSAYFPLRHWGKRVDVTVAISGSSCGESDFRVLPLGVGHVHIAESVTICVEPYYLVAIENEWRGTPDPIEVMAEAWAIAKKPFYSTVKLTWWRSRIVETYRSRDTDKMFRRLVFKRLPEGEQE
jgi:hypothetical protein